TGAWGAMASLVPGAAFRGVGSGADSGCSSVSTIDSPPELAGVSSDSRSEEPATGTLDTTCPLSPSLGISHSALLTSPLESPFWPRSGKPVVPASECPDCWSGTWSFSIASRFSGESAHEDSTAGPSNPDGAPPIGIAGSTSLILITSPIYGQTGEV